MFRVEKTKDRKTKKRNKGGIFYNFGTVHGNMGYVIHGDCINGCLDFTGAQIFGGK